MMTKTQRDQATNNPITNIGAALGRVGGKIAKGTDTVVKGIGTGISMIGDGIDNTLFAVSRRYFNYDNAIQPIEKGNGGIMVEGGL